MFVLLFNTTIGYVQNVVIWHWCVKILHVLWIMPFKTWIILYNLTAITLMTLLIDLSTRTKTRQNDLLGWCVCVCVCDHFLSGMVAIRLPVAVLASLFTDYVLSLPAYHLCEWLPLVGIGFILLPWCCFRIDLCDWFLRVISYWSIIGWILPANICFISNFSALLICPLHLDDVLVLTAKVGSVSEWF